jgi:hypothetical protein
MEKENVICATEPNEMHDDDLVGFEFPEDGEELLTVNLTPRNQAKKFKFEK